MGGRERERGREREKKKEGERERVCEKGGEREKKRKYNMYFNCPEFLFLFLKGMMGALAPFSCLV